MNSFFKTFLLIAIAVMTFSCSSEDLLNEVPAEQQTFDETNKMLVRSKPNIVAAVVTEGQAYYCDLSIEQGYNYSVHAFVNRGASYDRTVMVSIFKGTSILESKALVIPAYQNVSANQVVFNKQYYSEQIGSVSVRVIEVRKGLEVIDELTYSKVNTTYTIQRCLDADYDRYDHTFFNNDGSL